MLLLQCTFGKTLQTLNSDIFRCIDFVGLALEYLRKDDSDPWVKDFAQCILAVAITHVRLDDDAWIVIVGRYLKPQHFQYLREDHNLRLCNLIYLIQQLKDSRLKNSNQFKQGGVWRNVLVEALKFEIREPVYDLQLEFRALLDELRFIASGREQSSEVARSNAGLVLSCIPTALHEATAVSSTRSRTPTAFVPSHEATTASSTGSRPYPPLPSFPLPSPSSYYPQPHLVQPPVVQPQVVIGPTLSSSSAGLTTVVEDVEDLGIYK